MLACQEVSLLRLLIGSSELRSAQQAFTDPFQPGEAPPSEQYAEAALKPWLCPRAASKMCPAEQPMSMHEGMLAVLLMDNSHGLL